jgi:mannose-6-phosphate isomerase
MISFGPTEMSLSDLIASNPQRYLGERCAKKYGSLPFLLKLLAAEKPLSIQAHPNLFQAREGFSRENLAGLALDAPERSYKDPNHKPEIICGLTPFTGMCGFREPIEIQRLLKHFLGQSSESESTPPVTYWPSKRGPVPPKSLQNAMAPLIEALATTDPLRNFLKTLFSLSSAARQALTAYIKAKNTAGKVSCKWELMFRFAELYPGDPAMISPLYLNVFQLKPGEAVFLEPGTLHSYVHGFGVELMANSDNVLRAGLTSKYVDTDGLMNILDFTPHKPEILTAPDAGLYTYPAPCNEFSLSVIRGRTDSETIFEFAPAICVVTSGGLEIIGKKDRTILKPGESVFISPAESPPVFRGKYDLYAASIPEGKQSRRRDQ